MMLPDPHQSTGSPTSQSTAIHHQDGNRNWYAVSTLSKHEKSVARHLDLREVEAFLPTYEASRVWKNRQQVKLTLPLFPTYIFVRIGEGERLKTLGTPGTISILGNGSGPLAIPESEIHFLQIGVRERKAEPYREPVIGERVQINSGVMKGFQGTLVRKNKQLRLVLEVQLLSQCAAVEVDAQDLISVVT